MRNTYRWITAATAAILLMGSVAADAATAEGNLRYSITVKKFDNEAGWHGKWSVGDGFATILTDALNTSGKFIVLGDTDMREAAMDEQDLAASGRTARGKKTPKTGQLTPAQLLVRGSVTHVQEGTKGGSGGLSFKGIRIGGSGAKAEVNITIYLVDSETGQVKASTKVVGTSGKRGLSLGYSGSKLGGLTGDMAGFKKDNVGKACQHAVAQAVEFLAEQIEDIPWEGSVVLASGEKIAINRGSREGVAGGAQFKVGKAEELVDEDTGEVLDVDVTVVATIEAVTVKEKLTYCKLVSGNGVAKGMSIFPAD